MRFFIALSVCALTLQLAAKEVLPRPYYGKVAVRMANMLSKYHVLKTHLNDDISVKAWTNVVAGYDVNHSVFLQSDIDVFEKRKYLLDNELVNADVSFGFDVYSLFCKRIISTVEFVTNYLNTASFDFSLDEEYLFDRSESEWPKSLEESRELWKKRVKNDVLINVISHEIECEKSKTNRFDLARAVEQARTNAVKRYVHYLHAVTDPDEENVLQQYLSSVTRAYDPHTDYMSPASKEDFDINMNLVLCGVGAVLTMDDGPLKIVEVMPGGPMDRDGRIKKGDRITGVMQDGGEMTDITWQPLRKTIKKIRGAKGTKVTLEIIPRNDLSGISRKRVELVRDEIKLEDQAATGRVERVSCGNVTNKLGYVYLPSFYGTMDKNVNDPKFRSSAFDVARYLCDFNAEGVKGLVLDLRGNGGGSLREAVMLSGLFVRSGPVVLVKDLNSVQPLVLPYGNPVAFKKPVVVLTDRASASASEIVAAHLHDTGRALVLGDAKTHGKGTVQSVMSMGPEKFGSLKVTTARFYRINGDSTQLHGMPADYRLPSLLDSLDIGEDKLPCALPFSKIRPADYALSWNMYDYLPAVRDAADRRLAANAEYMKHVENVAKMKVVSERKSVPLLYGARKEMILSDRALHELDGSEDGQDKESSSRLSRRAERKDDIVLKAAFDILNDLVRLNKGRELPMERHWWE